ncbi:MAG: glycosyltransferase family 2 protein [Niastella sp.]|nr:glycosyltransferase family 2 protein [Niastella sp.]
MLIIKTLFWVSFFILFYSYIGYGMLLWVLLKLKMGVSKTQKPSIPQFEPPVSLIIATYNEQDIIEEKITNCFALDYPKDKLQLIFVADGSNDNTVNIIQSHPDITLYYEPGRSGKVAAINRVMPFVTTPIVIYSDANTFLNSACIKEIVKHYADEKVGAVAGEKKVIDISGKENAAGAGEGLYWKYESYLKRLDSAFYTVVGAAGELFSIRTALFEPTSNDILLDDFIISLKIAKKGYRVVYEPLAFAAEAPSHSMQEEQKRKVRISAGGFQSMVILKELLNIFKYGKLSFQYISHRVLRWAICPFLLPLLLFSNILLYTNNAAALYSYILWAQCLFYGAATAGWLFSLKNIKVKVLYVPYYFVFMNLALYIGLVRFYSKRQSVLWEKAKRKT